MNIQTRLPKSSEQSRVDSEATIGLLAANEKYFNLEYMRRCATKLVRKIAPSHLGDALADDMAMAGIERALRDAEGLIYYQDVRTAMLDELFRWILGVTAHQGRRERIVVQFEDWMSEFSRTERDGIERQVMARRCLRKICDGDLGQRRSKKRRDAIWKVCNSKITRQDNRKMYVNARNLIKEEIARQLN